MKSKRRRYTQYKCGWLCRAHFDQNDGLHCTEMNVSVKSSFSCVDGRVDCRLKAIALTLNVNDISSAV